MATKASDKTPKPRTTKKATATARTATKKATPKKTAAKKVAQKATKKKAVTKKPAATKAKATKKTTAEKIVLPNRMPMRAQEKALVLSNFLDQQVYRSALLASKVCGICFVLVGATASFAALNDDSSLSCVPSCAAQLPAGTDLLPAQPSVIETIPGAVSVVGEIPSQINTTESITIEVTQAIDVLPSLQFVDSTNGTQLIPLSYTALGNDKYEIEIRGSVLQATKYTLKVEVQFAGNTRYDTFTLGTFVGAAVTSSGDADEVTTVFSERSVREAAEADRVNLNDSFTLLAPANASQVVEISMSAAVPFTSVDFFLRAASATNNQFVGTVTTSNIPFRLDTLGVPNGTYELFARGTDANGTSVRSKSVTIEVFNRENVGRNAGANNVDQQRQLLTISRELNSDLYEDFEQTESVDDSIALVVDEKLTADQAELDTLFTAYAVARQAGDEQLILKAKNAIDQYRTDVVSTLLMDENDRFIADEFDESLALTLEDLQDKVDTFEKIRSDRTESDSATDTDGDGVSDIDEQVLYGTDPNSPDTDGDGFTDGVEIISGYDPLDDVAEVPVVYESPKETIAAVRTDQISVTDVAPDVALATASTSETVGTIVRGVSLPNVFLTLYVFSTPTIVTVRTEADGSFEYTFTKELEDGEHQVFAALTDNAGEIVAQSLPFTFIKEAQAFTPVEANAADDLVTTTVAPIADTNQGSYQIAMGMSVLALGIILIMLGIGLRGSKPDDIVVE